MDAKGASAFLDRVGEYLISLPFDLKVLQEAVTDPDLDKAAREVAAGTIVHTLLPQEGEPIYRFVDDLILVRAALARVVADGGEGAQAFKERFADVYGNVDDDCALFAASLGDLWPWLTGKIDGFAKLSWKGRRPAQYVDDEDASAQLYDDGLEFQTNFNVKEDQVRNKLRKSEAIIDVLQKRRAEEAKKKQ